MTSRITFSKLERFIPFLLAIGALLFHSINLDYASYDLDEAVHIWHAQKSYHEVVEQASNDPNPPVYNLIISAWVKQFGVSEFSTRFFSVIMSMLGTLLMYWIGKRNFGVFVGIAVALLFALSPIQFRFTHLARPYALLMVSVLLSYGFLFETLRQRSSFKLIGYLLSTSFMIYVHPTSVFNVPAQVLIILWRCRKNLKTSIWPLMVSFFSVGSFLVWVFSVPYFERNDTMWFSAPDLDAVFYVIQVFYASNWLIFGQVALITVIFMLRFLKPELIEKGIPVVPTILWIFIPFSMSIAFSHLIKPVFQDKYILTVQPALMMLLAISIQAFRSKWVKVGLLLGSVALLLSAADFTRDPEGDWKTAVNHLKNKRQHGSAVFINPWYEFRTFSYYFDRSMYMIPDSTVKLLAQNNVYWAWYDVCDTVSNQLKFDTLHVFSAHEDFVENRLQESEMSRQALLIEEKQFIGIRYRCYQKNKFQ